MPLLLNNSLLELNDFISIINNDHDFEISEERCEKLKESYNFLFDFSKDKIIYGINTGLGPMAQYKIQKDEQVQLQLNLIRSHAVGAGNPLDDATLKAAMLARLNSFLQGKSGVHYSCIELLSQMIKKNILPFIPEHGGVGASGDLVQLAHLGLNLIGEGKVKYQGEWCSTEEVFKKEELQTIQIKLREGLAIINGTSVMTGMGINNLQEAKNLFNWSLSLSCIMNEIVESFDDHFSDELNFAKRHKGQREVARQMQAILGNSKRILKREEHFFTDQNLDQDIFSKKVQEYYSLRCVPQILGPVFDTINNCAHVLEDELNSANDNPIVSLSEENVLHGGNFHGDYISLEMDKLKMVTTRMSMLSERQLNFLFNNKINKILPPFINLGKLGLNLGMQAMQFTATSTTAECQTISNPMYVHSIPNNNDNQDIVSMGTNSAILCQRVLNNTRQVLAIQIIAVCQAIDYLKIESKLSPFTQKLYSMARDIVPVFIEDTPKYEEMAAIEKLIKECEIKLPTFVESEMSLTV
ncbi:HAL/PAL/TAL family ammonia-lyase [Labilibaculum antarcticum]|uniref:Histidine ammonia-lyase n=1 Tax=Labilibaculum antarcticum TaxID=1717717 RepID=A0A1Y1CR19_9BACT|nr:aromatic amino acid ammonia-lyase [Labilibaculum antarcticum]BAX82433.1 histidine ammonia-lyase [Labilibaculum antarcticum]